MDNGLLFNSKPFRDVISGKFPEDAIKKMNYCTLQHFVIKLVEFTTPAGKKSVSMVNKDEYKPRWWPRNVVFGLETLSNNRVRRSEIRVTLQQLIVKCSEFFRNKSFEQIWLPANRTKCSWVNGKRNGLLETRGIKRTRDSLEYIDIKKRRHLKHERVHIEAHLVPQFINTSVKPVVYLHDIFKIHKPTKPLTQQQFLKLFELSLNNNATKSISSAPQYSKVIKLHNCPHIPLSSDVGKAIIKRENYGVPEYSTAKKIERLEWYVNKTPPKHIPQHYELTFVENNVSDIHYYKFPKKQFHQYKPNEQYMKLLLNLCKPLKVMLERDDLISKKKYYDNLKVTVKLNKLSGEQLNKHLCKDIKVLLTKSVCRSRALRSRTHILK